ncbi:sugar transferase [Cryobacterium frigoriphilum]|uniref:Sugar transferase n=1 Tax=Cryobacterium frigoriphilum TaxID=1259150 RepID=A0A4R9A4M6_9MICO|nr:sugar transferase [Cryobacterium frigoriphilum]TFD52137.1 sugar transferase [Cryobacterium frigoriphilum]
MSDPQPILPVVGAIPLGRRPRLRLITEPISTTRVRATDTPSAGRIWAARYRHKLRLTDVGVIIGVVGIALIAVTSIDAAAPAATLPDAHWLIPIGVAATWIITLGAFHTRGPRVVGVGSTEYKRVVNASALTFGLLAITFLVLQVESSRVYFLVAFPLGVLTLSLERWLWRKWLLRQRKFNHYLARAIVVGSRDDVEYVVGQIDEKSGAAYRVVGAALDEVPAGPHASERLGVGDRSIPIVADLAHAAGAAANLGVDTVIVAGHPRGGSTFIRALAWELEGTTAELVLSSRLTDVAGPRIHFRPVEGLPLIHVEIPQFEGGKHVLKRALDVVACGASLIALAPLLAVIALLIRFTSPGPVLFAQERVGRDGHTFRMLKFRSMENNAEDNLGKLREDNQGAGLLFKLKDDPRVTRIGRFLRKHSLDELPQIWNVLVGDMSLVGPRPPLPDEVRSYENHVHRRLYIKPGLTGMWQINGRSDLSWEESVRLDLYYVENWSLAGDLMIIWRTFKVVLNPVGAY